MFSDLFTLFVREGKWTGCAAAVRRRVSRVSPAGKRRVSTASCTCRWSAAGGHGYVLLLLFGRNGPLGNCSGVSRHRVRVPLDRCRAGLRDHGLSLMVRAIRLSIERSTAGSRTPPARWAPARRGCSWS